METATVTFRARIEKRKGDTLVEWATSRKDTIMNAMFHKKATRIRPKKIAFRLELRNRFETLQELDDINTMSENITDMIQQTASRVAKAVYKPHKSRISSPTRVLVTKRREMAGNGDNKQRIECARPSKRKQERTSGNITIRS